MKKVIVKVENAKLGQVIGTGAGHKYSKMTAQKISKPFILKSGEFEKMYIVIGAKAGDTVCFLYC